MGREAWSAAIHGVAPRLRGNCPPRPELRLLRGQLQSECSLLALISGTVWKEERGMPAALPSGRHKRGARVTNGERAGLLKMLGL